MSVHGGPKVSGITNPSGSGRLVFSVDFANRRSYPGSGTSCFNMINRSVGTLTNGPTYSGSRGGFLSFTTDDFISFNDDTTLDGQNISVGVWARTNATTQNGFFFEKGTVNTQYSLFQGGANFIWRQYYTNISAINDLTAPAASYVDTNDWFHLVGTFTSGTRRLYVNGKLIASDTQTGTLGTNSGGIRIGSYNTAGYYYNGDIGVVRVWTYALSEIDVRQNFNALRGRYRV